MGKVVLGLLLIILSAGSGHAASRSMSMVAMPSEIATGATMRLQCSAVASWLVPLTSAKITVNSANPTIGIRAGELSGLLYP